MARKNKRTVRQWTRGQKFETCVRNLLEDLAAKFPKTVKVRKQPTHYEGLRQHRPDFELEYKLGGLQHGHLIECQDRDNQSHELGDKIVAVRGSTEFNRYIFIYRNPAFLKTHQEVRLKSMGVLIFDFNGFESFLRQLEASIALQELGLQVLKKASEQSTQPTARKKPFKKDKDLLDSARKHNPDHDYPGDRAMLS